LCQKMDWQNISHSHQFAIRLQVLKQNQIEYWNLFE
jgi:hypothetical protein